MRIRELPVPRHTRWKYGRDGMTLVWCKPPLHDRAVTSVHLDYRAPDEFSTYFHVLMAEHVLRKFWRWLGAT